MPKLFYAPKSRASRVIGQLLACKRLEDVDVCVVDIHRYRETGTQADPANPHPEGKVPFLVLDDGDTVRESAAIMQILDEILGYPLGIAPGQPGRGQYLSWLTWYHAVLEPTFFLKMAGITGPEAWANFRDWDTAMEALTMRLQTSDWLAGDRLTVADMLIGSTFQWLPDAAPDDPKVLDWIDRVNASMQPDQLAEFEAKAEAELAARKE